MWILRLFTHTCNQIGILIIDHMAYKMLRFDMSNTANRWRCFAVSVMARVFFTFHLTFSRVIKVL